MMNRFIVFLSLLIPLASQAKTLEYGFVKGEWFCNEQVYSVIKRRYYNSFQKCTGNNLWDIKNRDDIVWKKDGLIHKILYNEFKKPRNVYEPCGLVYNPRSGVTKKFQKCVKTFRY